jgi:hypothetical protein
MNQMNSFFYVQKPYLVPLSSKDPPIHLHADVVILQRFLLVEHLVQEIEEEPVF